MLTVSTDDIVLCKFILAINNSFDCIAIVCTVFTCLCIIGDWSLSKNLRLLAYVCELITVQMYIQLYICCAYIYMHIFSLGAIVIVPIE